MRHINVENIEVDLLPRHIYSASPILGSINVIPLAREQQGENISYLLLVISNENVFLSILHVIIPFEKFLHLMFITVFSHYLRSNGVK